MDNSKGWKEDSKDQKRKPEAKASPCHVAAAPAGGQEQAGP